MGIKAVFEWGAATDDLKWLSVKLAPLVEGGRKKRAVSESGVGRGTGRGGKSPASKLTKPFKLVSKRSDFMRYVGTRECDVTEIMKHFGMTRANVNGFLMNIHRDHGVGYEKIGDTLRMILPKGSTLKTIGIV